MSFNSFLDVFFGQSFLCRTSCCKATRAEMLTAVSQGPRCSPNHALRPDGKAHLKSVGLTLMSVSFGSGPESFRRRIRSSGLFLIYAKALFRHSYSGKGPSSGWNCNLRALRKKDLGTFHPVGLILTDSSVSASHSV